MLDILSIIPGKKKVTPSGWNTFNGICCHHRGHSLDRRSRAGIKFDGEIWNYHCFNCGFKCGIQLGKHFSKNLKMLLSWSGVDQQQIEKFSFESFSLRGSVELYKKQSTPKVFNFKSIPLPDKARPLSFEKDQFHIEYLKSRGLSYLDYPYHVVDGESRQRLIIPYYYNGEIVGNTSRYYDNRKPKYISEQQAGYVFNIDKQVSEWNVCILVEGQFDAISIDGCAYMSANISNEQANLISRLRKKIIVVPDRDKTGMSICDRALELGYHVSIPNWADDIKDANDAVRCYGKLATIMSIIQASTNSKIIIEMKRRKFR